MDEVSKEEKEECLRKIIDLLERCNDLSLLNLVLKLLQKSCCYIE